MAQHSCRVLLVLAVTSFACSSDSHRPSPAAPGVITVEVTGGNRIEGRGRTLQLRASVRFSDGTTQDQTGAASWSSSNSAVATVSAGLVTAAGIGVADISAVYRDVRGVLALSVVPITIEFTVVSEGFNIENLQGSSFLRNGEVLASSRTGALGRGFNVAAINPASGDLLAPARNFDTWGTRESGTAMNALVAFLNGIPSGTLLLVAVHDEAGLTEDSFSCLPNPAPGSICCRINGYPWTEPGLRAIEALGARDVRRYCYRNSYSLIAVKGSGARSEQLANAVPATARFTLTIE